MGHKTKRKTYKIVAWKWGKMPLRSRVALWSEGVRCMTSAHHNACKGAKNKLKNYVTVAEESSSVHREEVSRYFAPYDISANTQEMHPLKMSLIEKFNKNSKRNADWKAHRLNVSRKDVFALPTIWPFQSASRRSAESQMPKHLLVTIWHIADKKRKHNWHLTRFHLRSNLHKKTKQTFVIFSLQCTTITERQPSASSGSAVGYEAENRPQPSEAERLELNMSYFFPIINAFETFKTFFFWHKIKLRRE